MAGRASVPSSKGADQLGVEPEMSEPIPFPRLLPDASARERLQEAGSVCLLGSGRCVRRALAASASGVGWGSRAPQAVCRRLGAHAGMGCRRDAAVLRDQPAVLRWAHAGTAQASASLKAVWSPAVGGVRAPLPCGTPVNPVAEAFRWLRRDAS